jgi:excisionase family DNA binding protein
MARTLLDVEGAAVHLSVSPRFVRRLVAQRRVPYLKVGKFVRFDPVDLDAWLEGCRVESVSYGGS